MLMFSSEKSAEYFCFMLSFMTQVLIQISFGCIIDIILVMLLQKAGTSPGFSFSSVRAKEKIEGTVELCSETSIPWLFIPSIVFKAGMQLTIIQPP
jgi:hypothetical protein